MFWTTADKEKQSEATRELVKQAYVKPEAIEKHHRQRENEEYTRTDYYYAPNGQRQWVTATYDSRRDTHDQWNSWYARDPEVESETHSHHHTAAELADFKSKELKETLGAAAFLMAASEKHERNLKGRLPAFATLFTTWDKASATELLTQAQAVALVHIAEFSGTPVPQPAQTSIGLKIASIFQGIQEQVAKKYPATVEDQVRGVFQEAKPPFGSGRLAATIESWKEKFAAK